MEIIFIFICWSMCIVFSIVNDFVYRPQAVWTSILFPAYILSYSDIILGMLKSAILSKKQNKLAGIGKK